MDEVSICYNLEDPSIEDMPISGDYIPITPLDGLCKSMNYCGLSLYLTKFGHGFNIPSKAPTTIEKALERVPVCVSREVAVVDEVFESKASRLNVEEEFRIEKCLDVTEKISNLRNNSRRDYVTYIAPIIPGKGNKCVCD